MENSFDVILCGLVDRIFQRVEATTIHEVTLNNAKPQRMSPMRLCTCLCGFASLFNRVAERPKQNHLASPVVFIVKQL